MTTIHDSGPQQPEPPKGPSVMLALIAFGVLLVILAAAYVIFETTTLP